MKNIVVIIVAAASISVPALGQTGNGGQGPIIPVTQTAGISGMLKSGATNAALSGETVTVYRSSTPVYRAQTTTGIDGSFTIPSLPSGTYRICVDATKDQHLDPCSWNDNPPSITVADGQASAGNVITVAKGAKLTITVVDPHQYLQARTGDLGPGHVFLALVTSKGAPIPIPLVQMSGNTLQQQLVIPADTSFQVLAFSKEVTLADPNQKPVPASGGIFSVSVSSNASQTAPVILQVTGRRS
jgi:hypothetical protein